MRSCEREPFSSSSANVAETEIAAHATVRESQRQPYDAGCGVSERVWMGTATTVRRMGVSHWVQRTGGQCSGRRASEASSTRSSGL